MDKAWSKIETPAPGLGSREIAAFILEAAGSPDYQQRATQIEAALAALVKMQDGDPASKTYGNLCWYRHEDKPSDLNAVQFATQPISLVKFRYADHLSPKAAASLDQFLTLAIEGVQRQKVNVNYTNIYLMKSWNLLALGEALKKPELTREGSDMLDQWMAFASKNGISEFLSPTAYPASKRD